MDRAFRWFLRCGLISLLLAISGCASRYHEPSRSDNRSANLEAIVPVWIVSIDQRKVSSFSVFGHKRLRVASGPHVVEVQYFENLGGPRLASTNNVNVKFLAQPGRAYYIRDGRIGIRWQPYVTDTPEPVFSDLKLN